MDWRNRIVGYAEIDPEQALANEENWRIHPHLQSEALRDVLRQVGIVQNVVINVRSSPAWPPGQRNVHTVLDGHLRIMLALQEGQRSIPATLVDLTPEEERLVLALFDTITTYAVADRVKLAGLLDQLGPVSDALDRVLSDLRSRVTVPDWTPPAITPEQIDHAADAIRERYASAGKDDGLVDIVCPHCGGIFGIDPAELGKATTS